MACITFLNGVPGIEQVPTAPRHRGSEKVCKVGRVSFVNNAVSSPKMHVCGAASGVPGLAQAHCKKVQISHQHHITTTML